MKTECQLKQTDSTSFYKYFALRRGLRLQRSCDLPVYRLDDLVARKRNDDDVAGRRDVHDALRDRDLALAQLVQEPLALLLGSVPDEQWRLLLVEVRRAVVGQVARNEIAHRAEADPAELDLGWEARRLGTRVW